jgi:hypothetical protein
VGSTLTVMKNYRRNGLGCSGSLPGVFSVIVHNIRPVSLYRQRFGGGYFVKLDCHGEILILRNGAKFEPWGRTSKKKSEVAR